MAAVHDIWMQPTVKSNPEDTRGQEKKKEKQTHITGILIKQDRVVNTHTQIKQKHIPSYFDGGKKRLQKSVEPLTSAVEL